MSWLYSRALVEAFSEGICSGGERYAPSSSTLMPQAYLPPDKMTEFSRLSRFGMTFAPLTESLGAELLMWYRAAFRVKTLAQQETAQESLAAGADFGQRWQGSLARFDHVSHSWKTAQCSLLGDSESYSETWPRWGSMRNGASYLRPIPELPICENASGSWPTPVAQPANGTPARFLERKREWVAKGSTMGITLSDLQLAAVASERGMDGRGLLNPAWVEWLMGWPLGWTELKPLEMGRFHEWQQQHGEYFTHALGDFQNEE